MDYDGDETHEREEGESNWGSTFSLFEEECLRESESSLDLENHMTSERESGNHRMWLLFQASACSIAQLYKGMLLSKGCYLVILMSHFLFTDRMQGQSMWPSFQTAAANVTHMYKECLESQKKMNELCIQTGVQRRNKDVMNWLKKKKSRSIRREELLGFICGKNGSSKNSHSLVNRSPRRMTDPFSSSSNNSTSSVFGSNSGHEHRLTSSSHLRSPQNLTFSCLSLADASPNNLVSDVPASDLQPFRDALSASMTLTNPRVGRNRFGVASATATASPADLVDLNAFITEEFNRNFDSKKRSFPVDDVTMSSPTNKKPKYL